MTRVQLQKYEDNVVLLPLVESMLMMSCSELSSYLSELPVECYIHVVHIYFHCNNSSLPDDISNGIINLHQMIPTHIETILTDIVFLDYMPPFKIQHIHCIYQATLYVMATLTRTLVTIFTLMVPKIMMHFQSKEPFLTHLSINVVK